MKNIVRMLVGLLILFVLVGVLFGLLRGRSNRAADQNTAPSASTAPTQTLSQLMLENAQLMLQAGNKGIDARKRDVWASKAQTASQFLKERRVIEATQILSDLNAEMRAAI